MINVKTEGAKRNGVDDDRQVPQALINDKESLLDFPPGRYLIEMIPTNQQKRGRRSARRVRRRRATY